MEENQGKGSGGERTESTKDYCMKGSATMHPHRLTPYQISPSLLCLFPGWKKNALSLEFVKCTLGREELRREPIKADEEELIGGVGVESSGCQRNKKGTIKLDQKPNHLLQPAALLRPWRSTDRRWRKVGTPAKKEENNPCRFPRKSLDPQTLPTTPTASLAISHLPLPASSSALH